MMNSLTRTIYHNAHIPSLIISTGAVMGGLTASVIRGGISVFPAIMTLLFALFLQISANLYHGYFDRLYGAGENISGMADRGARSENASTVIVMRLVANGFALLALTAGLWLFAYTDWLGAGYFALIIIVLYFYLAGPHPIVRTKWSIVITFLLFGPIAVSGTALVQNPSITFWVPVAVYSMISGLLAANAHIAIMYKRYEEDLINGKETIVTVKGGFFTRFVYLGNSLIVAIILILRPTAVTYVNRWVGIVLALCLLASSSWVFSRMHRDPRKVSRMVTKVTLYQYIGIVIVLMLIVLYSIDDFNINVLHMI